MGAAFIQRQHLFAISIIFAYTWKIHLCYLLMLDVSYEPGTVIFNSSLNRTTGSDRIYNINSYKNAHFIQYLFHIDYDSGEIILKTSPKCDGIHYPTLFSLYIDSSAVRYTSVDYYCLLLRIYIVGDSCKDSVFTKDKFLILSPTQRHVSRINQISASAADTRSNHGLDKLSFPTGKKLGIAATKPNQRLFESQGWISESYASFGIPSTRNTFCLRKSKRICNLKEFMPATIKDHCQTNFVGVSDYRVEIDSSSQELIAATDICVTELMWRVSIDCKVECDGVSVMSTYHRLHIIYHHQKFNGAEFVTRVRRELRHQSPFFEQALYIATVLEEEPGGLVVTTLQAHNPENSSLFYSMTSILDSRSQSLFKIDPHFGVVTTMKSLDREMLDVHYFQVFAIDDNYPQRTGTTTLQVNIIDINDNYPLFEAESFLAEVREGSPIGTAVITVRANDQDRGENAKIEYEIKSVSGEDEATMEQDVDTFGIDSKSGVITTKTHLDREETSMYTIIVIASDSPKQQNDRKTSTATVVLKVLDENDNYPQFTERVYVVHIKEDLSINEIITHIKAIDSDEKQNAEIRYAIIGGNSQSQFAIDSISGEVSLSKPLDYETVQNFRIVVRAQDGGNPSRSNTTQLLIDVIDVNDNPPRFYVTQFQESVLENVPVGFNVIRVQAYDPDQGANADIRYSIMESEENFPLVVDEKTGWIQTVKQLDREHRARFEFSVFAVDKGIPPRSATANVVIIVQDVNDNDPVFQPKYYETAVGEDIPPGSMIATVTATDPDENSRLHYDIVSGNTRARFTITVQNGKGIITVTQPLDYKKETRFLLTVTATDSGGRMDTAYVNINVTDANNFAPTFDNSPYAAVILEDAPIGTTVVIVSATDNDVGLNAKITYSLQLEGENSRNHPFVINSNTGAITTIAVLDREITSTYTLTVKASDNGQPMFSDTTDVEISIADVNDNFPTFKVDMYRASVSEDAPIGTPIIHVCADDIDSGVNGRIIYSLSQKDTMDGSFIIDSTSGTIRTNKILDRESIAVYNILAIATDRGEPPLSSAIDVQIKLEDVNDSPPLFATDKITMYIQENSPIGSLVGTIEAHDPDEGANAVVHYSIAGGTDSNLFSLIMKPDASGAQLLTTVDVDYESTKKYFELIIRAASPPLGSDVHVNIFVTDVNDNAPTLKDFHLILNNYPGYFPVGEIGRIPAFDADVTDKLRYRILSGNNAGFIRINESSGGIVLSPQLNTNVHRHIHMDILVSDGINEVKATMTFIVRLITENMLSHSITVRLKEINAREFLSPIFEAFRDALSVVIPCPKDNILIFAMIEDDDTLKILNVSFSALKPDVDVEEYFSAKYLQERIYLNRELLTHLAVVDVLPFDDTLCVREPCLNFEECSTVLRFHNASTFILSDSMLFRPIYPVNTFACHCPEGFTGSQEHYLCDTEINLCYSNPCRNNGTCVRREQGYTCQCTTGFTGPICEITVRDLAPCPNNTCAYSYPCRINKKYVDLTTYTETCGLKAKYFSKGSFLTLETLRARYRFNIKITFATLEYNGLLFYNGRFNDLHDFIALEIIDGRIAFSFSVGSSKETARFESGKIISDGAWHTVEIHYFNRTATVTIDECDIALGLKTISGNMWQCVNQTTFVLDENCSSPTVSCHRFLDLTGPFHVGGLSTATQHAEVKAKHFIGCIMNLYIDHKFIDLNSFISENGTTNGCLQKAAHCKSEPCFNGGTCIEAWNRHLCHCAEGYSGSACQEVSALPWRFSENSALSFNPLLRPIQLPWMFGFSMRTLKKDALLVQIQIGQNSSVIVHLENGLLSLWFEDDAINLPFFYLSDGKWHRIEVTWLDSNIRFSVDYDHRTEISPISKIIQGNYVGKVILGSVDMMLAVRNEYGAYEGCIQDLRIGGVQNILNSPPIKKNIEDGCMSKAQCPHECPANSKCVKRWDEAECECMTGYIGSDCVPVCALYPCNFGECFIDIEKPNSYRCECNSTYSGLNCEHRINLPCPSGWWGKTVCGPCKCNVQKGYNASCNQNTGECHCKDNHYQPQNESSCIRCDCYHIGSISSSCDILTGQCICKNGVVGRRCDSCASPYAEVTYSGCEVVYDACPRSFSNGIWWDRAPLGKHQSKNCPSMTKGKAFRLCDEKSGRWQSPDLFNCTSDSFLELRKQLLQIENRELELNSFLSIRLAYDMIRACKNAVGSYETTPISTNQSHHHFDDAPHHAKPTAIDSSLQYSEAIFSKDRLYGADVMILEGLLHQIISFERSLHGLNMSHTQDKHFISNIAYCASLILSKKYSLEWNRVKAMKKRGSSDLVELMGEYLSNVAASQYDTFTKPFEVVHDNIILGLDIISFHKWSIPSLKRIDASEMDAHAYFQYSAVESSGTWVPKYDNYIQDKNKFDRYSKVRLPFDVATNLNDLNSKPNFHAIITYVQYKEVGNLFPEIYDETILRKWGVYSYIASPLLSLDILVLNLHRNDSGVFEMRDKFNGGNAIKYLFERMQDKIQIVPHVLHNKSQPLDNFRADEIHFSHDPIIQNLSSSNHVRLTKRDVPSNKSRQTSRVLGSQTPSYAITLQLLVSTDISQFKPQMNPQCVRWNRLKSSWTRLGCQTEVPNYVKRTPHQPLVINCTCTQISTYAVLMEMETYEQSLELSLPTKVTLYVLLLSSLLVLLVVLVALMTLRGVKTNSNNIHQNLVMCIFWAELFFLIGIQAKQSLAYSDSDFLCKSIAILLHYTWLSAFIWMTIDCFHLYRMLTEMRDVNHSPMTFYFSLGYGFSAIIVGLSVGVRSNEYGNSLFCWISIYEPAIWWLLAPICCMSSISLIILFMCTKSAFTLKNHILGFGNLRKLILVSVLALPLMNIVLVLSVLSSSQNSQTLMILLCAFVFIHAVYSVIGYCIINQRVQDNLRETYLSYRKKVPLVDSSNHDSRFGTVGTRTDNTLHSVYNDSKHHTGISTSSTTSKSTTKTGSSPYRSDSRSSRMTSSNTADDYSNGTRKSNYPHNRETASNQRKISDIISEIELASSHSSDDDERNTQNLEERVNFRTLHNWPSFAPQDVSTVNSLEDLSMNINKPAYNSHFFDGEPNSFSTKKINLECVPPHKSTEDDILFCEVRNNPMDHDLATRNLTSNRRGSKSELDDNKLAWCYPDCVLIGSNENGGHNSIRRCRSSLAVKTSNDHEENNIFPQLRKDYKSNNDSLQHNHLASISEGYHFPYTIIDEVNEFEHPLKTITNIPIPLEHCSYSPALSDNLNDCNDSAK